MIVSMRMMVGVPVVLTAVVGLPGCFGYVPPGTSLRNHYKTSLPAGVTVLHYYSDAYKDPQFLWVLQPVEQSFLQALFKNGQLKAPAAGDPPLTRVGGVGVPWWDAEKIEQLPEVYYRDPGPDDGSYYRIWVDRPSNRLYVLFMNT